jgi:hypothetical protein
MYMTQAGKVKAQKGKKFGKYAGNLNADMQLSWSNTFRYKDFNLYVLVNGRIGGKVISLTEAYLDRFGMSERTGAARAAAEAPLRPFARCGRINLPNTGNYSNIFNQLLILFG